MVLNDVFKFTLGVNRFEGLKIAQMVDIPDGRFRFLSDDKNTQVFCIFKKGELLKGPQLVFKKSMGTLYVRSQTHF